MTIPRLSLCLLLTLPLAAQQTTPPAILPPNHNLIVIDPAHGGPDNGAHLKDNLLEKDINLALANRLKAGLIAKGFQVASTRDGDTDPTADQRAEFANQRHPFVCVLLHASSAGFGPYLAASPLTPESLEFRTALPWDTAQSAYVADSLALLNLASKAFTDAKQPAVTLHASVPPIDSLTCPAILLELAPLSNAALTDEDYQQRVVDSLTAAIISFREQADTVIPKPAPKKPADTIPVPPKPAPRPKLPKPTPPPSVTPATPGAAK